MESHTAPVDHLTLYLQIYPPQSNGNFTDSCSNSSYLIPTLRAQMSADQVLADLPPTPNGNDRVLLWELIMLADQVLADLPPMGQMVIIDYYSESSYFIPILRAHIWQKRCLQIYPPPLHQIVIIDSYSERSYFADQVLADPTPPWMAVSQIHALTTHIRFLFWELIFGRPGVGRSNPLWVKWQFLRFLLWELILGRPGIGRFTPFKWWFCRFLFWWLIL